MLDWLSRRRCTDSPTDFYNRRWCLELHLSYNGNGNPSRQKLDKHGKSLVVHKVTGSAVWCLPATMSMRELTPQIVRSGDKANVTGTCMTPRSVSTDTHIMLRPSGRAVASDWALVKPKRRRQAEW